LIPYSEVQARKTYQFLVRRLQRRRLLGKFEHKWKNSIEIDLREFGYEIES
jgi:hypothetical protein